MPYNWKKIQRTLEKFKGQNDIVDQDLEEIAQAKRQNDPRAVARVREQKIKKYRNIIREKAHNVMHGPGDVGETSMLYWIEKNMDVLMILTAEDYSETMPNSEIANIQERCKSSLALLAKFSGHDLSVNENDAEAESKFYGEMKQELEKVQQNYYDVYYNNPTLGGSVAEPEQAEEIKEKIPTPQINREQLNLAFRALHNENYTFYKSFENLSKYDVDQKIENNRELNLFRLAEDDVIDQAENRRYRAKNKELIEEGKDLAERRYRNRQKINNQEITEEGIKKARDDEEKRLRETIKTTENRLKSIDNITLLHVAAVSKDGAKSFNERWNEILADNKDELNNEMFGVMKGPKSLSGNDMAQWYIENHKAIMTLAAAFNNGKTVINEKTDKLLEASVKLALQFQVKCDSLEYAYSPEGYVVGSSFKYSDITQDGRQGTRDSINMEAFEEDGALKWGSRNELNAAQDLFQQVKENFEVLKNDAELKPYMEAAASKELQEDSIDGVIAGLKKFRSDLKATDPFYVINSSKFRTLKDKLSDAIDALKEFKKHSLDDRMESVKDTLGKLQKAASDYFLEKSTSDVHTDRGDKRLEITNKLNVLTSKTLARDLSNEWGATNRKMLDQKVNLAKKTAGKMLFGNAEYTRPGVKEAFADAVKTFKKFPESDVKDARNELATAIGCAVQAVKKWSDDISLLDEPEFSEIKEDMVELAERGFNQIAKAKKASGINEPDYEKARAKAKAEAEAREDDGLDDDLDSEYGDDDMDICYNN